ncbi:MAG TPA: acyl carrier protein [Polyangiaceae bacterium]|nr:acyl carrier protein [Polyangiaceae bacterium]
MPRVAREEIRNEVETIIKRIRPDVKEVRDSDRLRDDLGLDSLHSMELLSSVTEKYEVDVDVEQLQEVRTVGDVVTFLAKVLG